ncbi:MAG: TraR/DksA family transcriptional regulator [Candidatus Dormibacteria bacterium]
MHRDQAQQHLEAERQRLQGVRDAALGLVGGAQESEAHELSAADQHPAEHASETLERELDTTVVQRVQAELAEVEAALARIEGGSYGRCEVCGAEIPEGRLEAMPAARFCLDDQARTERGQR